MQHVHSLNAIRLESAVLTIGSFDGVHRGHAALLGMVVEEARKLGAPAVVLTFHPHPALVLGRRTGMFCLTTPEERADLLADLGIDMLITEPFTKELADISAGDFMHRLTDRLGLKSLWIGHDFALGKGREGNEAFLRKAGGEMGFEVHALEAYESSGVVSSTRIRQLLREGSVDEAANLLGRPYSIEGVVVPGDQRGRLIGVPTANLQPDPTKLIPVSGVYACTAVVEGQTLRAAVNIGVRPTFEGTDPTEHIEAHLLDFSGDLYGKTVRLNFIERLRAEKRFSGIQELIAQIQTDIQLTREKTTL